jgi:hypothetical protein
MADPTPLEQALAVAHTPGTDMRPALGAFMNGRVILASVPGGAKLEGFQPLVISNGATGFLCVFSSTERIAAMLGAATDHVFAEMSGLDIVRGSTEGIGIALNPGSEHGMEISPAIVTALKATIK